MSINGSRLRFSTTIHTAQTARPAASRPIVRADPQPQPVVSVTAISVKVIPMLISSAAGQLTLPLVRTGDSGTNSQVASADSAIGSSGIQNSHCQASFSTISAPATMPTAAPIAMTPDSRPMLPATFSRGNSSRTIPNASGKMPPAMPCTARATISNASVCDSAASSVPAANRRASRPGSAALPYMSPSRPRSRFRPTPTTDSR